MCSPIEVQTDHRDSTGPEIHSSQQVVAQSATLERRHFPTKENTLHKLNESQYVVVK